MTSPHIATGTPTRVGQAHPADPSLPGLLDAPNQFPSDRQYPRDDRRDPLMDASASRRMGGSQTPIPTIAALFVAKGGCYFGVDGVDPWDRERDARTYAGPWPVVAHPPCERWGRYWGGAPLTWPRLVKGADDGCFAAALATVRRWGGVLEHPEGSAAWDAFGLIAPPHTGGWVRADYIQGHDGWTCCVEQVHYGHRARKKTWLYAHDVELPSLTWGPGVGSARLDEGFHSAAERRRAIRTGIRQRLSKRQRAATPLPFRDLLLSIAASARSSYQHPNQHIPAAHHDDRARISPERPLDRAAIGPDRPCPEPAGERRRDGEDDHGGSCRC